MKKSCFKMLKGMGLFFAAGIAATSILSCGVGLGDSVDTQAPSLEITYPPIGAIIRDEFVFAGTWSDDKSVTSISVTVTNTKNKDDKITKTATVNPDKTWRVVLNEMNPDTGKYELLDGTYQVSATAKDAAGHNSGEVSRAFDIDNTPPLFVVSNPGVVKANGKDASAYGSLFTIDGTISDSHSISSMNVDIYDSSNADEGKLNVETYIEEEIATAGGTSVTIAAFNSTSKTKDRFTEIYGAEDTLGTKEYYCSVELYDAAIAYKNPTGKERTAEELASDALGNHTTSLYLYDEVYSTLVSTKKGFGYSYADLMNILNGTFKADANSEAALAILHSAARNTSEADNRLSFSLNPLANPSYTINGFEYNFEWGHSVQSASAGNSLSITLQAGLDGTNIDPSVAKVWLLQYGNSENRCYDAEEIRAKIKALEAKVKADDNDKDSDIQYNVCEFDSNGNVKEGGTVYDGWKLIFENSDYNGSSVSQKTFSVTLPVNSVKLNNYYYVAVTGYDVDDVYFAIDAQNKFYGFEGNEAGIAPTVEIRSPANLSIVKSTSAENLVFTGNVYVNSASLYANRLNAKITVTDESAGSIVGYVSEAISRESSDESWPASRAFTVDGEGNWIITPEEFEGYDAVKAEELAGKSYLYTLEIKATSSSGHEITVSSMVHVDTVAPIVAISSVTPTVSGSEYFASSTAPDAELRKKRTYVNGNIAVKGNIEETNLKNVSYDIWARAAGASIGTKGQMTEENSILAAVEALYPAYNGQIGKVFSKTVELPTNAITWIFEALAAQSGSPVADPQIEFEIVVYAEDECGNIGVSYTSDLNEGKYYVIKQETDQPVITLGNSSNSSEFKADSSNISESNGNLFGTTSNNRLSISFSDDDSIYRYSVTVYDEAGNLLDSDRLAIRPGSETEHYENPYSYISGKTTASLSYTLPPAEGVYQVQIDAVDGKFIDSNGSYSDGSGMVSYDSATIDRLNSDRTQTTGRYFVAVSKGAPSIYLDAVNTYQTSRPVLTGSASGANIRSITAKFIDPATDGELETQPASINVEKTGSDWSSWTSSLGSALENNDYAILYTATNKYGQSNTVTAAFTVDTAAPVLAVTSYGNETPASALASDVDFYVIPTNIYTVKGTVSDALSGVESVLFYIGDIPAGKEVPSASNGWSVAAITTLDSAADDRTSGWTASLTDLNSLSVKDGSTAFTMHIAAADKAGNICGNVDFIKIYPDASEPEIAVHAKVEGGKIAKLSGDSAVEISGTANLVNGTTYYASDSYILSGTVTEEKLKSLKINGQAVAFGSDGKWSYPAPAAADGSKEYTIVAIDEAGNSTTVAYTFVLDTTAPVVGLTVPVANGLIGEGAVISGSVSDGNGIGVETVHYVIRKGGSTQYDADATVIGNTWKIEGLTIEDEGEFSITLSGTDKIGKSGTNDAITFYYDKAAPVVVENGDSTKTVNGTYTLSGTVQESNGLLSVTIKDSASPTPVILGPAASGNGFRLHSGSQVLYDWEYTVNPVDETNGSHIYTITATDITQNSERASNTITRTRNVDTQSPVLSNIRNPELVKLDDSKYVTLTLNSSDVDLNSYSTGLAGVYYIVQDSSANPFALSSPSIEDFTGEGSQWSAMSQGLTNWNATFNISTLGYTTDRTVYAYYAAMDLAGNITVSSECSTITIDEKLPVVTLFEDEAFAVPVVSSAANPLKKNNNAVVLYAKVMDSNVAGTDGLTASEGVAVSSLGNIVSGETVTGKKYRIAFTASNDGSTTAASFNGHDTNSRISEEVTAYIVCDTVEPSVSGVTPAAATPTKSNTVTIRGIVDENNISDITVYLIKNEGDTPSLSDSHASANYSETASSTPTARQYSFTATIPSVADGEYYIAIVANDTYGNTKKDVGAAKYVVDTTKPTVGAISATIENFNIAEQENSTDFILSVDLADGTGSGIDEESIVITKNGTALTSSEVSIAGSGSTYSFTIDKLAVDDGSNAFTISVKDNAGNENSGTITVTSDIVAPAVAINGISPTTTLENIEYVNGKITVSGTASDTNALKEQNLGILIKKSSGAVVYDTISTPNVTVAGLILESAAESYKLKSTYKTWNFIVDTSKLDDDTTYTVEVEAKDAGENNTHTETKTFAVKQTTDRPGLAINSLDTTKASISDLENQSGTIANIFATNGKLNGTVSDDDGIQSIVITVTDDDDTEKFNSDILPASKRGSTSYTIDRTLASLGIVSEGGYTINILVSDTKQETEYKTNNTTFAIAVDNALPEIVITSPTSGGYFSKTVNIAATVFDGSKVVNVTSSGTGISAYAGGTAVALDSDNRGTVSDALDISSGAIANNFTTGYEISYSAKDRWGRESTASLKFYKDATAPSIEDDDSSVGGVVTKSEILGSWFKDESLRVAGVITENESKIETVYYWLNPSSTVDFDNVAGASEFGAKYDSASGKYTYASTISGFKASSELTAGYNTLVLRAKDAAENLSQKIEYQIYIDDVEPELVDGSVVTTVNSTNSVSSTLLANGNYDITISGQVKDLDSKIDTSKIYISVGSVKISSAQNLSALASWQKAAVSDVADDDTAKDFTVTIPKESIASGYVYLLITDKAGNRTNNTSLVNITLDNLAPNVTLNTPSDADTTTNSVIEVNGKISFAGKASDNEAVSAVTAVQYRKASDSEWTDIDGLTFSGTTSWTSSEFDTASLDDETDYQFRAVVKDSAENIGYSTSVVNYTTKTASAAAPVSVKVSQDTDRPIIKITGLVQQGDSYILKYGSNSRISGTVTDDDSENGAIVADLVISETQYTGTGSRPSTSTFSAASGDWTFTPSDGEDGSKDIFIYIEDNAGNKYYTGQSAVNKLKLPKIYFGSDPVYDSDSDISVNNAKFTYVSDSAPPRVDPFASGTRYASNGTTKYPVVNDEGATVYTANVNSSFIAGGTKAQKADFEFAASDNNEILGFVIEIKDSGATPKIYRRIAGGTLSGDGSSVKLGDTDYSVADSAAYATDDEAGFYRLAGLTQNNEDSTISSVKTDILDFADFASGQVTASITAYDKSGLYGISSFTFVVDNAGPSINVSTPSSSDELTGDVSIIGQCTDTYTSAASIRYVVPNKAQRTLVATAGYAVLPWAGALSLNTTPGSWQFNLDDADNDSLNSYDKDSVLGDEYYTSISDGIYVLPVWFRAEDTLGNISYYTAYSVRHNPEGDKPVTIITYPTSGDYTDGAAILNGSVRVTGSATVPSNTTTINNVYLQIDADGDGDFDGTDRTILTGLGYTVIDYSAAYTKDNAPSPILEGFTAETTTANWWGIATDVKSSSWSRSINDGDVFFNADRKNISIRACAVNNNGKLGTWSDTIRIKLDTETPQYEVSLVKFAAGVSRTGAALAAAKPVASQEYSANMFIRGEEGEWFFKIVATDNVSVNTVAVAQGNTTLAGGTGYYTTTLGTANSAGAGAAQTEVQVFIPISVASSKVTYKVTISDNASPVNTVSPSFTLNIDNVAPTFTTLTANSNSMLGAAIPNIEDSDYRYTLKGEATDTGSGFERTVFYFVRNGTVGEYSISENVLIDPFVETFTAGSHDSKVALNTLETLSVSQGAATYNMYGKKIIGGTLTETTFTAAGIDGNRHIRKGGLIYVDGVYRLITEKSGNEVTFSPATVNNGTADAVFPYAQVVDNSGEGIGNTGYSPLVWDISEDDGDGMIENVSSSGVSATWSGSIHSCNIPDGPVTLVVLVFDAAGNVNGKVLNTFVSNNAPRIAKVNLATDLNGDNTFRQSEFVEYSLYSAEGETKASYSLDFEATKTNVSADGTSTTVAKFAKGVFTIKDALAIVPEFTGGNGTIQMVYAKNAASAEPVAATGSNVAQTVASAATDSSDSYKGTISTASMTINGTSYTVDDLAFNGTTVSNDTARLREASSSMYAFVLDNQQITGKASYGEADDGTDKGFSFTFWDSTEETEQGTSSQSAVLYVKNFTIDVTDGVRPVSAIRPFYWKGGSKPEAKGENGALTAEDNSLVYYETYDAEKASSTVVPMGHVEYAATPSVSGTVKVEGTAYDDQRLSRIAINYAGFDIGEVSYTAATGEWSTSGTLGGNGYTLTAEDEYLDQRGHLVNWTLLLDTAWGNANGNNIEIKVTSTQAKNAATKTSVQSAVQTANGALTNLYKVNAVPYITGIDRGSTTAISEGAMNRSRFGSYPVSEGETITVRGFNFGDAAVAYIGNTASTSATVESNYSYSSAAGAAAAKKLTVSASTKSRYNSTGSFTMTVPANSGKLYVKNATMSLNNDNDNNAHGEAAAVAAGDTSTVKLTKRVNYSNREVNAEIEESSLTTDYTDDRYLFVWNLGNYFKETNDGVELREPVMAADKSGNLFASWVNQTNSQVRFSYGLGKVSTAIFRSYDQPQDTSSIAFDTKGTSGGVNVTMLPNHQGYSASFSNNGLSSAAIIGGVGAISIPKTYIDAPDTHVLSGTEVMVDGNPILYGDSNHNTTAYYNLINNDMNRRLGSYINTKSARFGNNLHSIWYDTVTEGLRYSVVSTDDKSKYDKNVGAVVGWVVLDGGYTGQDRLHTFGNTAGKVNNTLSEGSNYGHAETKTTGNTQNPGIAKYTTEVFLCSGSRGQTAQKYMTSTTTSVTYGNYGDVTYASDVTPAVGDTIALLKNTQGDYAISLRTILGKTGQTLSWNDAVGHAIQSATIYTGNMNVVGGTTVPYWIYTENSETKVSYSNPNKQGQTARTADLSDYLSFRPNENQSTSAGLSADIDVTTAGYPVVAYYDAANSELRVAAAGAAKPELASNWTRYLAGKKIGCSGEVSIEVDNSNGVHIMFKNKDGKLCYLYSSTVAGLANVTASDVEIIDSNGTLAYGGLSLIQNGTAYTPCVTYLNSANTASCIKYAVRKEAAGTASSTLASGDEWDYQILPSLGTGHYAVSENVVSIEGYKSGWSSNTTATVLQNGGAAATATPANVDAVIAFKSNKFETAYLKKE